MYDDLTVVVTNFNTPIELLNKAIESIRALGLHFIIVDDCSEEKYRHNLEQYGDRVLYMSENRGTGVANYVGYSAVKSKYVLRHDSDDELIRLPDLPVGVDMRLNPTIYPTPTTHKQLFERPYAYLNGAVMTKKAAVSIYAGVDGELHDDIKAFANLLRLGITFTVSDTPWYNYKIRKDSKTGQATTGEKKRMTLSIQEDYESKYGRT